MFWLLFWLVPVFLNFFMLFLNYSDTKDDLLDDLKKTTNKELIELVVMTFTPVLNIIWLCILSVGWWKDSIWLNSMVIKDDKSEDN